jgi:hypothetical protein
LTDYFLQQAAQAFSSLQQAAHALASLQHSAHLALQQAAPLPAQALQPVPAALMPEAIAMIERPMVASIVFISVLSLNVESMVIVTWHMPIHSFGAARLSKSDKTTSSHTPFRRDLRGALQHDRDEASLAAFNIIKPDGSGKSAVGQCRPHHMEKTTVQSNSQQTISSVP